MAYLLDTHVLIWDTLGDPRLWDEHRLIMNSDERLFVSVASLWEIEVKIKVGKLALNEEFSEGVLQDPFEILSIDPAHALAAGRLPLHHRDSFDRMLVAQAQIEGLSILSADPALRAYDVDVV